jgi:hypothetical protein
VTVARRAAQGAAYLFGGTGGPIARLDDPIPQAKALFGASVAFALDASEDGWPDLLVGADRQHHGKGDFKGRVFLFSGSDPEELEMLSQRTASTSGADVGFGHAVAALPDLDGDGLADYAASAPWATRTTGRAARTRTASSPS